jgi:Holliday junction resolvasome RuvABC endonuclease subunit
MKILGIDPGIHGGLAVVDIVDGVAPTLLAAIDVPTVGVKAKERVDVLAIRTWITMHQPDHAAIERGGSMPKQGVASTFKYGRAIGSIEATVALCGVPYTLIEPSVWKRRHGLYGADKEASRQLALQLFPSAAVLLARKKDHGRSEAMLIALAAQQGQRQ